MFPIFEPNRHYSCRINDQIIWNGYRALILQNELIQIVVLVDKGSEIVQFLYKPLDVDFLWHSANPFRHPANFVPPGGAPESPFFDHWTGGWFEVLPNGGPGCSYKGAVFGNFAETINIPWEYRVIEDTPQQVQVALWIKTYRTPFLIQKTLTLKTGVPVLFIEEQVINQGQEPLEFMWGHHPVVGAPFLDDTCRLHAPKSKIEVIHAEDGPDNRMGLHQTTEWPFMLDRDGSTMDLRVMPPASTRSMDNCYLKEFTEGWIAVTNPGKQLGFGLSWDAEVFRYTWIWQAFGGGIGYPWYGRTYNMGIEPWSSYPCAGLEEAVQRGTALTLQPGESRKVWLNAVAFEGIDEVSRIDREGQVE
jgi:hypothetical protein